MRTASVALVLSIALCACAKAASSGGSGVAGSVKMGPTCPVQHLGTPCDKAWTGTVLATDLNGTTVASVNTDASGAFQMTLDPGTYMIRADTPGQTMPRGIPFQVTVRSGAISHVVLQVDTGIR
jgi:hypothetical protein